MRDEGDEVSIRRPRNSFWKNAGEIRRRHVSHKVAVGRIKVNVECLARFIFGSIKHKGTLTIRRTDCSQQRVVLPACVEINLNGLNLIVGVLGADLGGRDHVRLQSVCEPLRGYVS